MDWGGTRWTTISRPFLAAMHGQQGELMIHELFHRIQPQLELESPATIRPCRPFSCVTGCAAAACGGLYQKPAEPKIRAGAGFRCGSPPGAKNASLNRRAGLERIRRPFRYCSVADWSVTLPKLWKLACTVHRIVRV